MPQEKEFVPHKESLELKELGFTPDYACAFQTQEQNRFILFLYNKRDFKIAPHLLPSPSFQQAFRWFREKFGFFYDVLQFEGGKWGYSIYGQIGFDAIFKHNHYNTYEQAELECLRKLIEIVKSKQA